MKRERKKGRENITARGSFPIFPLNVFGKDLGLFTESFKRRWILLALIASRRTFPASGAHLR